ncbi:hypothetical protein LOD44_07580 [Xylella fastidiosa subsp. multiplex]|nr:hypothetical protein [Xylella fastidiosa]ERI59817.1 hypothetical protein M233_07705 [Xylella fastidiosa subsp. multiplex Griffin-1]KAJ4852260.1 hypothetical protein XYFPCFBP8418_010325 [Xylella fastidiosa subsp. multiplex]MCP8325644.1 hypothetical protein [Xylella fastidiosa subsp. multiplex]MDC6411531.1 hypothetical protein [Xylella fastidiosa subsp. multiplex]MDC6414002.1 hypothetical protein [Xylella fastidiosa subsp. multiplex]
MTIERQAPFQFTWREIVNEEYQEWFKIKGIYALLLCLIIAPAWANTAKPKQPTLFQEIILEAGIENDLRQILGEHYDTFKNNFEMVTNPAHHQRWRHLFRWLENRTTGQTGRRLRVLPWGNRQSVCGLITTGAKYSILVLTLPKSTPPSKYGQNGSYRPPR